MWKKVHVKRKNQLIGVVGDTGSGKSYSSMKISECLDDEFIGQAAVDHIVFSISDFIKLFNEKLKAGTLRIGETWIIDEAGTSDSMSSKKWYDAKIQGINDILQMFRYLRPIVFFITPDASFITKDTRKLFHAIFQTNGIDEEKQVCHIKPQFIQINRLTGKVYTKKLKVVIDGRVITIKNASVGLPRKELIELYEKKKAEFGISFIDKTEKKINRVEINLDRSKLTPHQEQIYELKLSGLSSTDIADQLGVVPSVISETLKVIQRKGYEVKV